MNTKKSEKDEPRPSIAKYVLLIVFLSVIGVVSLKFVGSKLANFQQPKSVLVQSAGRI